jgi:hypothetical protein
MILRRLHELALREHLLEDPAFEELPVPYVILIGSGGKYLGIEERRGTVVIPSKKKGGEPKTYPDKGKPVRVPRAHGNTANPGFARYFADTLARVLPITDDEKSARSRKTFWEQIARAAGETDDPALRAIQAFGQSLQDNAQVAAQVKADVTKCEAAPSDRCTLALADDKGLTVLDRDTVCSWYRSFFQGVSAGKQAGGPRGVCQVTGEIGPLPTTHPIRLAGVPGGLPTGVSIVSYDVTAHPVLSARLWAA